MSQLFSDTWMNDLIKAWNNDVNVYAALKIANFSANIGYGFKGKENPGEIITIVKPMARPIAEKAWTGIYALRLKTGSYG